MSSSTDQEGPPAKKKPKVETAPSPTAKQSSLRQFFSKPAVKKPNNKQVENEKTSPEEKPAAETSNNQSSTSKTAPNVNDNDNKTTKTDNKSSNNNGDGVPEAIIPKEVPPDPKAKWKVVENCMLVRSIPDEPRSKAAAFDVDGTLLVWRIAGWPSKFEHYELWSADVISKLRQLHDEGGYKLVLISNQGAIRGAFTGKKATFVKSLFEWLAKAIDRPIHVVMSTNKKLGYHKPEPGMWKIVEEHCNKGELLNVNESFFVGDSVGDEDPQGGVDSKFAENVGGLRGGTLKFYTPEDYFGPCDNDKRKRQGAMADYDAPPDSALATRAALMGGYLQGPVVLILSGVQGSGKSTFCNQLFIKQDEFGDISDSDSDNENQTDHPWVHLSQDTINKGKPGKREAVEEKTRQVIREGRSVVIDRMHLEPEQRKYFVDIAKELKVPVHVVVFQAPKEVIAKRVRERTNHPGGVQGEKGVKVAMMSLSKMVLPKYKEEGFDLISCVHGEESVKQLSGWYRQVQHQKRKVPSQVVLNRKCRLSCGISMPTIALGTMNMGKRVAADAVGTALKVGIKAIDTAPTYKNEDQVGQALASFNKDTFLVVKVPKRASQPEQVRKELDDSLCKVKRNTADLLLLHWPCDVIEAGTLKSVWNAMEECVTEGKCRALGVCNFNVDALRQLLPHCSIIPAVNQVERHPLLPQMELLDFCANQGIIVQAHTPLGQGSLLSQETITEIAERVGLTPAQVLLKWNLQQGVAVVTKSSTEEHQKEALAVMGSKTVALSGKHMKVLDQIKTKTRFVAPPFMNAPGNVYTWKD